MENLNFVLDILVSAKSELKRNGLLKGTLKEQIGEAHEALVDKITEEEELLEKRCLNCNHSAEMLGYGLYCSKLSSKVSLISARNQDPTVFISEDFFCIDYIERN